MERRFDRLCLTDGSVESVAMHISVPNMKDTALKGVEVVVEQRVSLVDGSLEMVKVKTLPPFFKR